MAQTGAVSALLLCLATGCSSLPRSSQRDRPKKTSRAELKAKERFHVIELNPDGLLYDLRPRHGHKLLREQEAVTNYLAETIWTGFKDNDKTNILVFVHGGMNDRDIGLKHYLDDYPFTKTNYYPIFVVWPSGWGSTYVEHLLWVRQGVKMETKLERTFSLLTVPFMLVGDLGRAVTRLPMVIANNTRSDTETITPVRKQDGGAPVKDYQETIRKGYQVHIEDDYSLLHDRLFRDFSYNITLPVKWVFAALIDGLGQGAWDNMLRRTQTVYPGRMDQSERIQIAETLTTPTTNSVPGNAGTPRKQRRKKRQTKRYAPRACQPYSSCCEIFKQPTAQLHKLRSWATVWARSSWIAWLVTPGLISPTSFIWAPLVQSRISRRQSCPTCASTQIPSFTASACIRLLKPANGIPSLPTFCRGAVC